ncbi:MAG: PQQ-binding-like beta-propeller repeat protein [Planctomycetes bacterium]|nr:PQQ-binding-like beta-propeller repeat protein [Planctomycetota bacterium]
MRVEQPDSVMREFGDLCRVPLARRWVSEPSASATADACDASTGPSRLSRQAGGLQAAAWMILAGLTVLMAISRPLCAQGPAAGGRTVTPPRRTSWASFRNGNRQLGIAHCPLPEKLELLWKVPAPDGVVSAGAIVGDDVYVGTLGGELLCLDRRSGRVIWKYVSLPKTDPNTFAPGFLASPTVTADAVFLGDEDGVYHAIRRQDGRRLWTFSTDAEIISSTAVVGDHVIFGSYDSNLYCLDARSGSLVWKYTTEDRINGTPAVAESFAFVTGCDNNLRLIDITSGQQRYAMSLGTFLIASPAVLGDTLYVGTYAAEVLAVNWKTQEIVWRYRDPTRDFPYHSSAAVTNKYVVLGGRDKQVHCIDRKTGQRVWVFRTRGRVDSSPAIVDQRVFVGSYDRNLYCLRLSDGKLLWKFNAGRPISGSSVRAAW